MLTVATLYENKISLLEQWIKINIFLITLPNNTTNNILGLFLFQKRY